MTCATLATVFALSWLAGLALWIAHEAGRETERERILRVMREREREYNRAERLRVVERRERL